MLLQRIEGNDLQSAFVGRGQDDVGGGPVVVGPQPVDGGHTPTVAGYQAREAEFRHRCRQVVADGTLVLEELGCDHRADGVPSDVLGARRATTVTIEAGQRIGAAGFEDATEDVAVGHDQL